MNLKVLWLRNTYNKSYIRGIIKGEINLTVIEHNNNKTHKLGLCYLLNYIKPQIKG